MISDILLQFNLSFTYIYIYKILFLREKVVEQGRGITSDTYTSILFLLKKKKKNFQSQCGHRQLMRGARAQGPTTRDDFVGNSCDCFVDQQT